MPVLATPRPESPESSPRLEWPEFSHPATATIIALIVTLAIVNTFLFITWKLLKSRFAQNLDSVVHDKHPDDGYYDHQHCASSASDGAAKQALPTSEIENKHRQYFTEERTPLCNAESSQARGSLYDTFQIPPPNTTRLKFSRSMMELNGGNPLESGEGTPKAKTIHWHGINRLNIAWGWMS